MEGCCFPGLQLTHLRVVAVTKRSDLLLLITVSPPYKGLHGNLSCKSHSQLQRLVLAPAHFAEEESEAPELSDLLSLEVANQDVKLAAAYHAGTGRKDLDMASPSVWLCDIRRETEPCLWTPNTPVLSSLWDLVLSWQPDPVTVSVITGREVPEPAHPAVTPAGGSQS